MNFTLKAYSIWVKGNYRQNQEDNIYPQLGQIKESDRLFILCDGMGGHEHGEVASETVCESMSSYVLANSTVEGDFSDNVLAEAVNEALKALDAKDTGAAKKMGTTMTFLKLHNGGATIGHIGDSRVYHIRPGKSAEDTQILFQTRDHSLVNDLIKIGELTEEEAKNSPQKNIITRAMQPSMERRPKADIKHITDIRPGDYFYMCSDGMLEMDDDNLKFIFSKPGATDEEKVEMLTGASYDSHDNHSAHIIHITDVKGAAPISETQIPASAPVSNNIGVKPGFIVEGEPDYNSDDPDEPPFVKKYKFIIVVCILALIIGGCFLAYKFIFSKGGEDVIENIERVEQTMEEKTEKNQNNEQKKTKKNKNKKKDRKKKDDVKNSKKDPNSSSEKTADNSEKNSAENTDKNNKDNSSAHKSTHDESAPGSHSGQNAKNQDKQNTNPLQKIKSGIEDAITGNTKNNETSSPERKSSSNESASKQQGEEKIIQKVNKQETESTNSNIIKL